MTIQEERNPHNLKLRMSDIQKNRLALEYIRMNEQPDEFLFHNRFLQKSESFASVYESSDEEDD